MGLSINNIAEKLLLASVEGIEKGYPNLANLPPLLQKIENLLSSGFSSIIQQKYGITAQQEVSNLSANQVNVLTAELATAQATVTADTTTVTNDMTPIISILNPSTSNFLSSDSGVASAFAALSSPPTVGQLVALQTAVSNVPLSGNLVEQSLQQALKNQVVQMIQTAETDVTTLNTDQATVASIAAQLMTAQSVLNQAIALYDSLNPTEKELFQEFYPTVTFPS